MTFLLTFFNIIFFEIRNKKGAVLAIYVNYAIVYIYLMYEHIAQLTKTRRREHTIRG